MERFSFDAAYWKACFSALKTFFDSFVLPQLVLCLVRRGLKLDGSDVKLSSVLEAVAMDVSEHEVV